MGNKIEKLPPSPPKTTKELVKEFTKAISGNQRSLNREIRKMNASIRKMENDIRRMAKKGEPKASIRIIGQQMLRAQTFVKKYDMMNAKMDGLKLQLASVSTTDTLVNVMQGMGQVILFLLFLKTCVWLEDFPNRFMFIQKPRLKRNRF